MLRTVALAGLSLCLASAVGAQDTLDLFPREIGNRWLFEVEGVLVTPDTVDATVEWTLADVHPGTESDTLWIDVVQRNASGSTEETTCIIEVGANPFLTTSGPYNPSPLCTTAGGFPFAPSSPSSYPFFYTRDTLDVGTVQIGRQSYEAERATASFLNGYSAIRPFRSWSTDIRGTLASGVGVVGLEAIHSETGTSTPRRDTLRTRLVGAEIAGRLYGDIQPVASEAPLDASPLALRVGPNPARAATTVWVTSRRRAVRLSLLDALGRIVRTAEAGGGDAIRLDLRELNPGAYVVHARTDTAFAAAPLIVVR